VDSVVDIGNFVVFVGDIHFGGVELAVFVEKKAEEVKEEIGEFEIFGKSEKTGAIHIVIVLRKIDKIDEEISDNWGLDIVE